MPDSLEQALRRLDEEREEADQRYNAALTALDRALPTTPDWPSPPPTADPAAVSALERECDIAAPPPNVGPGWRGRLSGFIWRTIGPYLQRQVTFNRLLVEQMNRDAIAAQEARHHADVTSAQLREEFSRLALFHARTIEYLQQVTAYIDTRDRRSAGGNLVLNASLNALTDNLDKRWESLGTREQRADARIAAVAAGHEELRTIVGASQQAALSLKRELERLHAGSAVTGPREVAGAPVDVTFRPLDSYKYVGFEDQFRGSREAIRERLESYLPFFAGANDVLDVGCGRGEFLELLAGAGVRGRGIDLNHEMAELCRSRGLDVTEADAVSYLSGLPDASLGGVFAAQVVEHLQPGYLLQFLELAFHKIRPGGHIVLETLNPACWVAFFESFIRDITHVWPLHPETLKYLVVASGFTRAEVEFRSPVAPEDRLQNIAVPAGAGPTLVDLADTFNANVEKLNVRLFTHLDYAVIGTR